MQAFEELGRLRAEQVGVLKQLKDLQRPFKRSLMDLIKAWRVQFSHVLHRYKFLVLRGASCSGKSSLARSLGSAVFTQTVQNAETPNLKGFSRKAHDLLLFDNVNDMKFVLDNRALIQANADIHTLGESRTGMYSYYVWLWRVPIVVTVDLQAPWDSNDGWVKENCLVIELDGPSWEEAVVA